MKLSINEGKLTGLGTRTCATIQQLLILKLAFEPEKLPSLLTTQLQMTAKHNPYIDKV